MFLFLDANLFKGHDRESNSGLKDHNLSRYHYAIVAIRLEQNAPILAASFEQSSKASWPYV